MGQWYNYQPLGHIKKYFEENIAIYFAWLGECFLKYSQEIAE